MNWMWYQECKTNHSHWYCPTQTSLERESSRMKIGKLTRQTQQAVRLRDPPLSSSEREMREEMTEEERTQNKPELGLGRKGGNAEVRLILHKKKLAVFLEALPFSRNYHMAPALYTSCMNKLSLGVEDLFKMSNLANSTARKRTHGPG